MRLAKPAMRCWSKLYDYSNKLMELALEEEEIPVELLHSVIREATFHQLITPVLCGSAPRSDRSPAGLGRGGKLFAQP